MVSTESDHESEALMFLQASSTVSSLLTSVESDRIREVLGWQAFDPSQSAFGISLATQRPPPAILDCCLHD